MSPPVSPTPTSITAFLSKAARGPLNKAVQIRGMLDYAAHYGEPAASQPLGRAVQLFFENGGGEAWVVRVGAYSSAAIGKGLGSLDKVETINLICLPGIADHKQATTLYAQALAYCETRRAMLLVDPPSVITPDGAAQWIADFTRTVHSANAAAYFPWLLPATPAKGEPPSCPPSGAVAGIFARIDKTRGVWKAPAGQEATVSGIAGLAANLTDAQNDALGQAGLNCLRTFPGKPPLVWGARTLAGQGAEQWKYVNVRRLSLFIEQSIDKGLQWVVFEPNGETLWQAIRQTVGDFLFGLFRQGALMGTKPEQAYFVKCDASTMTQADIDNGVLIIIVGVAPVRPAEFVIITLRQLCRPA